MITLTICNHKGGTGKTTTVMNLAAAFGMTGRDVLVVDLDPQAFLTRMMGETEAVAKLSSLVLFEEDIESEKVPITQLRTFDLVPSSAALSSAIRRLTKPTDVLWLREFVDCMDKHYDLIIFDIAAAVTVFSLNALVASNFVVIPVLPEYQPVLGGEQTYQTAQVVRKRLNPDLAPPKFLLTMVDGRKRNHLGYRKYLRERYGEHVMRTVIRTCTALSLTRQNGQTVFESDPQARGSIDYASAADELGKLFDPVDGGDLGPKSKVEIKAHSSGEQFSFL
ncbi:MAG: ParA family protein [Bacteroidetes bacterium]|nr:ParA family protein [Bacteroidota bacterium]